MTLSINVNGDTKSFEIGESNPALGAINSYKSYQLNHKYEDLKKCFANLHYTVNEAPDRKWNACMACNALAFSVFNSEPNAYSRCFIANSVSSIIVNADLCNHMSQIKELWDMSMIQSSQEIEKNGFNRQAAIEAGLAVIDMKL